MSLTDDEKARDVGVWWKVLGWALVGADCAEREASAFAMSADSPNDALYRFLWRTE